MNRINFAIIISLLILAPTLALAQVPNVHIIPLPNTIESRKGTYSLGDEFKVYSEDSTLTNLLQYVTGMLGEDLGLKTSL